MTIARAHLVDPAVTRWYHRMTRCARAFLFGEGSLDRMGWIEHRLEELAQVFSISVAGFTVLDNHLHVPVLLDPQAAAGWSDEEVVRRWGRLFPPRDRTRRALPVFDDWVQERPKDAACVATARERLRSLRAVFLRVAHVPGVGGSNGFSSSEGATVHSLNSLARFWEG